MRSASLHFVSECHLLNGGMAVKQGNEGVSEESGGRWNQLSFHRVYLIGILFNKAVSPLCYQL